MPNLSFCNYCLQHSAFRIFCVYFLLNVEGSQQENHCRALRINKLTTQTIAPNSSLMFFIAEVVAY
jgi:hypothetical protein